MSPIRLPFPQPSAQHLVHKLKRQNSVHVRQLVAEKRQTLYSRYQDPHLTKADDAVILLFDKLDAGHWTPLLAEQQIAAREKIIQILELDADMAPLCMHWLDVNNVTW